MLLNHAVEVFPVMTLSDEALLKLGGTEVKSDLLCMHHLLTHLATWAQSTLLFLSICTLLTITVTVTILFLFHTGISLASKQVYLGHGVSLLDLAVLHDRIQLQ